MAKSILISISPNTQKDDVFLSIKTLFNPKKWLKGSTLSRLPTVLKKNLNKKHCYLFNSGRAALQTALESLKLTKNDQVLCQAFTCVAVPNAIIHSGAQPLFVDINKDFNLSYKDLLKKITSSCRALIVQHTFGRPANLKAIKQFCRKHRLVLIEDCAHSLGGSYHQKPLGSFGDFCVLSFGRDKAISSVFGGALLTNRSLSLVQPSMPKRSWVLKQLLHPLIITLATPLYFSFSLGKLIIWLYQRSGLLSVPVLPKEKNCQTVLPLRALPNALAVLALHQLKKLDVLVKHRLSISRVYQQALNFPPEDIAYLRFPFLVKDPALVIKLLKKHQVLLGNWYRPVIAPTGVDLQAAGYKQGSCPQAEKLSQQIINLPTHIKINKNQALAIARLVKPYAAN